MCVRIRSFWQESIAVCIAGFPILPQLECMASGGQETAFPASGGQETAFPSAQPELAPAGAGASEASDVTSTSQASALDSQAGASRPAEEGLPLRVPSPRAKSKASMPRPHGPLRWLDMLAINIQRNTLQEALLAVAFTEGLQRSEAASHGESPGSTTWTIETGAGVFRIERITPATAAAAEARPPIEPATTSMPGTPPGAASGTAAYTPLSLSLVTNQQTEDIRENARLDEEAQAEERHAESLVPGPPTPGARDRRDDDDDDDRSFGPGVPVLAQAPRRTVPSISQLAHRARSEGFDSWGARAKCARVDPSVSTAICATGLVPHTLLCSGDPQPRRGGGRGATAPIAGWRLDSHNSLPDLRPGVGEESEDARRTIEDGPVRIFSHGDDSAPTETVLTSTIESNGVLFVASTSIKRRGDNPDGPLIQESSTFMSTVPSEAGRGHPSHHPQPASWPVPQADWRWPFPSIP